MCANSLKLHHALLRFNINLFRAEFRLSLHSHPIVGGTASDTFMYRSESSHGFCTQRNWHERLKCRRARERSKEVENYSK